MSYKLVLGFLFLAVLVSGCTSGVTEDTSGEPTLVFDLKVVDSENYEGVDGVFVEIIGIDNSNSYTCNTDEEGNCNTINDFGFGNYHFKSSKGGCITSDIEEHFGSSGDGFVSTSTRYSIELRC